MAMSQFKYQIILFHFEIPLDLLLENTYISVHTIYFIQ